jgi:hypothetical protein
VARSGAGPVAFRFKAGLLEGKVPLGGLVGIVNEHEAGVVAQSFSLLNHGDLILADETSAKELRDRRDEGDAVKDVPRGDDVDAAGGRGDRGDGGQRGEPLVAGLDDLGAAVGQGEVDGGLDWLAVDA